MVLVVADNHDTGILIVGSGLCMCCRFVMGLYLSQNTGLYFSNVFSDYFMAPK